MDITECYHEGRLVAVTVNFISDKPGDVIRHYDGNEWIWLRVADDSRLEFAGYVD